MGNEEMQNSVEELEEQAERQNQQMQSLVQSHDELRMENYQLKEKVWAVSTSVSWLKRILI